MKTIIYQKKIFIKVDYDYKNRRQLAEIKLELSENDFGKICFSASGGIWNSKKTDYTCCGQCLYTILAHCSEPSKRKMLKKLVAIWERWHLNDMKAGTPKQEAFVAKYRAMNPERQDYKDICKALDYHDLLVDEGYKYGSAWLTEEIPAEVIEEIKSF